MPRRVCNVRIDPPRFDTHYATVRCHWRVDDEPSHHETGVPSRRALIETVATQRQAYRNQLSDVATGRGATIDVDVTVSPGFTEDLSERDVLGATTLGSDSAFDWTSAQPAYQTFIRPLRAQPGHRALDLAVDVEGQHRRVFVGARGSGSLVATGDTDWVTDLDGCLQACRLVAALGDHRPCYSRQEARLVDLAETPLAGCQPFQRRSVMWASPSSRATRES